ncbi:sarcosine oxidase subunit gamma family protein [Paraburkholderia phytofirmans]
MSKTDLIAVSAFANLPPLGRHIQITDRDGCGIVVFTGRRGRYRDVVQRIRTSYGIQLPSTASFVSVRTGLFAATGPETWLHVVDNRANAVAHDLVAVVGDAASVVDQSDGCGLVRLSGASLPSLISSGASIDMRDCAFPAGKVATTQIAHMTVTLWRMPDSDKGPTFEFLLSRSFALSFWHWLSENSRVQ